MFQSTPPRRRRPCVYDCDHFRMHVSIHASTQEATCRFLHRKQDTSQFQSTPPRRRRHALASSPQSLRCCFNPRLHAGGDSLFDLVFILTYMFQSTPPRRRRQWHASVGIIKRVCFNPRLHAGGDSGYCAMMARCGCFNPRLHAGGDRKIYLLISILPAYVPILQFTFLIFSC